MHDFILYFIIFILSVGLFSTVYYLWKFAKIILIFEDDIDETLEALGNVENTILQVSNMQLFFDSPEVKKQVNGILEEIKICRSVINKIIHKFTERSKKKYVSIWEDAVQNNENIDADALQRMQQQIAQYQQMPGQPPGTPNPLDMINKESVVLDVRH